MQRGETAASAVVEEVEEANERRGVEEEEIYGGQEWGQEDEHRVSEEAEGQR
eukprot:gene14854-18800_t